MNRKLSVKTLFRSWAKTIFTFILIGAVTFGLFSQVAEYVNTKREFESNIDMYRGIGTVETRPTTCKYTEGPDYISADPRVSTKYFNKYRYSPINNEQIDEIAAMPYVSSVDKRYMTGGLCDDVYRMDDWVHCYDYAARMVVEGTLEEVNSVDYVTGLNSTWGRVILKDCKILAGQDDIETVSLDNDGSTVLIEYDPWLGEWSTTNERVNVVLTLEGMYNTEYFQSLPLGGRYVFVVRYERHDIVHYSYPVYKSSTIVISDCLTEPWCKAVWDVTEAPENYLELEEYASLKQCIDITNADIHTLDVVYAGNMSVIRQIENDSMRIKEGRWLTDEDTENSAPVCVINAEFAEMNGYKLGDTVSLKLGDELFEQYFSLGAVAVLPERYSDNWTDETSFEIVGIYSDISGLNRRREPNWTYSNNTVFVPVSYLPVTEEKLKTHEFAPSEFSFSVDNAWDIKPFVEECIPRLEEMGFNVIFDDGGWPEVAQKYSEAQKVAMLRIIILMGVTVVASGFVVFLFINRKRKDYAIMRALGTTKKRAGRSLVLPLIVLSAAGTAAGIAVGVVQMLSAGEKVFAASVVLCAAGEILVMLLLAVLSLIRIGKRPPLALLQETGANKTALLRKESKETEKEAAEELADAVSQIAAVKNDAGRVHINSQSITAKPKNAHSVRFVSGYILRHVRRSKVKTALTVILTVLISAAIVQFIQMRETYAGLEVSTVITPKFIGSLSLRYLEPLEEDGFANDIYYEESLTADLHHGYDYTQVDVAVTNDLNRYTNEKYEIKFALGYDESCFDEFGDVIIIGNNLALLYDLELGQTVRITPAERMIFEIMKIRSKFAKEYPDLEETQELLYQKYGDELNKIIDDMADEFTIAGIITTPSGIYGGTVFTPGKDDLSANIGTRVLLDFAEFRLADNKLVEEMRSRGEELTHGREGAFVMDTEKLDSVKKTSGLLKSLYPVVIAAALIIGGFMSALIIIQTSKDAAIMRIQGTTKKKTRAILAIEQIVLSVLGSILGVGIMWAVKGTGFGIIARQTAVFAGLYAAVIIISSVVSTAFATRKNVLELLQTKE